MTQSECKGIAVFAFGFGFGFIKDILLTIITFLATQKVGCQISVGIIIHYCYVKRDMYMNRLTEDAPTHSMLYNVHSHTTKKELDYEWVCVYLHLCVWRLELMISDNFINARFTQLHVRKQCAKFWYASCAHVLQNYTAVRNNVEKFTSTIWKSNNNSIHISTRYFAKFQKGKLKKKQSLQNSTEQNRTEKRYNIEQMNILFLSSNGYFLFLTSSASISFFSAVPTLIF